MCGGGEEEKALVQPCNVWWSEEEKALVQLVLCGGGERRSHWSNL